MPSDNGNNLGSGVLWVVGNNAGWVVTNHHVIRGASSPPTIIFPDGNKYKGSIGKSDPMLDLCWIKIKDPGVKAVKIATSEPKIGSVCYIGGYGGNGSYLLQAGRVSQYVSKSGHSLNHVEISGCEARGGDSGGPIFNDRHELVGVLWGSNSDYRVTVGCRIGPFKKFLGIGSGSPSTPITCDPTKPTPNPTKDIEKTLEEIKKQIAILQANANKPQDSTMDYDKLIDAMAKDGRFTGPAGKDGTNGKDGRSGRDGTSPELPLDGISHITIVVNKKSPDWPRLKIEVERAQGAYNKIRIADVEQFNISGKIPKLIEYKDGTSVKIIEGSYNVSGILTKISRGEYP